MEGRERRESRRAARARKNRRGSETNEGDEARTLLTSTYIEPAASKYAARRRFDSEHFWNRDVGKLTISSTGIVSGEGSRTNPPASS